VKLRKKAIVGSAIDLDLEQWRMDFAAWRQRWSGNGQDYRERMRRICEFLIALRPLAWESKPVLESTDKTGFLKLQEAFAKANQTKADREKYIAFLEELRLALQPLGRKGKDQPIEEYTKSLKAGRKKLAASGRPVEALLFTEHKEFDLRLSHLNELAKLKNRLDELPGKNAPENRLWRDCFDDCVVDWEWAYLQVLVKLSLQYLQSLEDQPANSQRREWATNAEGLLDEAIEKLEGGDFLQVRTQGLHGLLAKACLLRATAPEIDTDPRLPHLRKALVHARYAVEMEPESVRERLVLLQIYGILNDNGQVKTEAEIALYLDPGPETLKAIAANFRERADATSRRIARRKVFQEAVAFFERALRLVESETLDDRRPVEQMERHAWAHYWLGRFHCELMDYEKGIAHERIGKALGFKPLESRVNLAWAFFEAKAYDQAEQAFDEAEKEADRQRPAGSQALIAEAPGEDKPIDELLIDLHLGRAFLYAERGVNLEIAEKSAKEADGRISSLTDRSNQRQQRAAFHECLGRIYYRLDKLDESAKEIRKAIESSARSGAYCCLLYTHLAKARNDPKYWPRVALECQELWMRARETDVRGRNRAEILDIRHQMRQMEEKASPPTSPPPPGKPAT